MRRALLISSPSDSAIVSKISKPLLFLYNLLLILAVEHVFGLGLNVVISSVSFSLLFLLLGVKIEFLPVSATEDFVISVTVELKSSISKTCQPGIFSLILDRLLVERTEFSIQF